MTAQGFARAMLDKALGFLLKHCQDYESRDEDCPVYRKPIPVMKQPRFEDYPNDEPVQAVTEKYEEGMYFPSGAPQREDRREEQRKEVYQQEYPVQTPEREEIANNGIGRGERRETS